MHVVDQAFDDLSAMDCIKQYGNGEFGIIRPPVAEGLARFVHAIETLGTWSVDTPQGRAKVHIRAHGEGVHDVTILIRA